MSSPVIAGDWMQQASHDAAAAKVIRRSPQHEAATVASVVDNTANEQPPPPRYDDVEGCAPIVFSMHRHVARKLRRIAEVDTLALLRAPTEAACAGGGAYATAASSHVAVVSWRNVFRAKLACACVDGDVPLILLVLDALKSLSRARGGSTSVPSSSAGSSPSPVLSLISTPIASSSLQADLTASWVATILEQESVLGSRGSRTLAGRPAANNGRVNHRRGAADERRVETGAGQSHGHSKRPDGAASTAHRDDAGSGSGGDDDEGGGDSEEAAIQRDVLRPFSLMHYGAASHDARAIELLFREAPYVAMIDAETLDVNAIGPKGATPLHFAAHCVCGGGARGGVATTTGTSQGGTAHRASASDREGNGVASSLPLVASDDVVFTLLLLGANPRTPRRPHAITPYHDAVMRSCDVLNVASQRAAHDVFNTDRNHSVLAAAGRLRESLLRICALLVVNGADAAVSYRGGFKAEVVEFSRDAVSMARRSGRPTPPALCNVPVVDGSGLEHSPGERNKSEEHRARAINQVASAALKRLLLGRQRSTAPSQRCRGHIRGTSHAEEIDNDNDDDDVDGDQPVMAVGMAAGSGGRAAATPTHKKNSALSMLRPAMVTIEAVSPSFPPSTPHFKLPSTPQRHPGYASSQQPAWIHPRQTSTFQSSAQGMMLAHRRPSLDQRNASTPSLSPMLSLGDRLPSTTPAPLTTTVKQGTALVTPLPLANAVGRAKDVVAAVLQRRRQKVSVGATVTATRTLPAHLVVSTLEAWRHSAAAGVVESAVLGGRGEGGGGAKRNLLAPPAALPEVFFRYFLEDRLADDKQEVQKGDDARRTGRRNHRNRHLNTSGAHVGPSSPRTKGKPLSPESPSAPLEPSGGLTSPPPLSCAAPGFSDDDAFWQRMATPRRQRSSRRKLMCESTKTAATSPRRAQNRDSRSSPHRLHSSTGNSKRDNYHHRSSSDEETGPACSRHASSPPPPPPSGDAFYSPLSPHRMPLVDAGGSSVVGGAPTTLLAAASVFVPGHAAKWQRRQHFQRDKGSTNGGQMVRPEPNSSDAASWNTGASSKPSASAAVETTVGQKQRSLRASTIGRVVEMASHASTSQLQQVTKSGTTIASFFEKQLPTRGGAAGASRPASVPLPLDPPGVGMLRSQLLEGRRSNNAASLPGKNASDAVQGAEIWPTLPDVHTSSSLRGQIEAVYYLVANLVVPSSSQLQRLKAAPSPVGPDGGGASPSSPMSDELLGLNNLSFFSGVGEPPTTTSMDRHGTRNVNAGKKMVASFPLVPGAASVWARLQCVVLLRVGMGSGDLCDGEATHHPKGSLPHPHATAERDDDSDGGGGDGSSSRALKPVALPLKLTTDKIERMRRDASGTATRARGGDLVLASLHDVLFDSPKC